MGLSQRPCVHLYVRTFRHGLGQIGITFYLKHHWGERNAALGIGSNWSELSDISHSQISLKQSEPKSSPKPKRKITNIINSQNTKITYGQPNEQLFPKRWPLSNRNRSKNNMNTRKGFLFVFEHTLGDTSSKHGTQKLATENHKKNYRFGTVSNELLGGGGLN